MSEREGLEQHLRYDHGWSEADLRDSEELEDDELLEEHDAVHAGDLDPHRAGTKDVVLASPPCEGFVLPRIGWAT